MAVSGPSNMAFWDALGQAAGKGVVEILAGSARPMRAYDSYGVVDPVADERDLRRSLEQVFAASRSRRRRRCGQDERVVKGVRRCSARRGADAGFQPVGSIPPEATTPHRAPCAYDLTWIEEPVPQENLSDMPRCARHRRSRSRPARTGGFRAAFSEAIAAEREPITSCPT